MSENITFVTGNLFDVAPEYSLAHCISKDLKMSKGIALEFRNRFRGIDELERQNPSVGKCLVLEISRQRFAFYLVTKEKYWQKPSYRSLSSALESLCHECQLLGINKLAMPRIGSGLDKLKWETVLCGIIRTFRDKDVEILIYSL